MAERSFILNEMSWPEVREALSRVEAAIVPVGSFEQHGPNMTFSTDTELAYQFSLRLTQRFHPRVILAPPVSMGISFHHMKFPGTITLRHETFHALIRDMVWSLGQHGLEKFFFVNGHAGNSATLATIMTRLKQELGVAVAHVDYFSFALSTVQEKVSSETWGHACEMEVSHGLYLAPQVVKRETLSPGQVKAHPFRRGGLGKTGGVNFPYSFDEVTANGALGDATKASLEMGREIAEEELAGMAECLKNFLSLE